MSMYNLLFGPTAQKIPALPVCGIDPEQVGRFRDVWIERDGDSTDTVILALYTRNGGGNREDYAEQIGYLHSVPTFVSDRNDDYDSTYATFRFRIRSSDLREEAQPEGQSMPIEEVWAVFREIAVDPVDTDERWQEAIASIEGRA